MQAAERLRSANPVASFSRLSLPRSPSWSDALQGIGQRIHYVLRVAAGRGKDDMEGSTLNELRDGIGDIGGVGHEYLRFPPATGFTYRAPRVTMRRPARSASDRDCAANYLP